jgi:hypothetical protein
MDDTKYRDVGLRRFALANGSPNGPVEFLLATAATQDQSATYVAARVPVECSDKVNLIPLRLAALREAHKIIDAEIVRLQRPQFHTDE